MLQIRYKAMGALVFSVIGFVAFYPYSGNFWGGLVYSGFLAATIGGLADWFAVAALFGKPLGISYRTAIIPRNRTRLLQEMITFASNDLLNPEHIMKSIMRYDTARMAMLYLEDAEGKEKIKALVGQLSLILLDRVDTEEIGEVVETAVKGEVGAIHLAPVILDSFRWSLANQYDESVIDFILNELMWIVKEPETHALLCQIITEIKQQYEGNLKRRQFVSLILDLSSARLAGVLQNELVNYLTKLQNPEHKLRLELKEWLYQQIALLEGNAQYEEMIGRWQNKVIEEQLSIAEWVASYLERQVKLKDDEAAAMPLCALDRYIERKFAELKNEEAIQHAVDQKIKFYIHLFVHEQHNLITGIIQERLDEFSDQSLSKFIEERVVDDLQMIRINGALVGAAVGMFLYTITYVAERLW